MYISFFLFLIRASDIELVFLKSPVQNVTVSSCVRVKGILQCTNTNTLRAHLVAQLRLELF